VLWGKTWYRYLTNVLDPEQLSPQQVCELYRNRWQSDVVSYLTQHQKLFGLVKSTRKRHREIDALTLQVWGTSSLS
jgi:hypothetical protein